LWQFRSHPCRVFSYGYGGCAPFHGGGRQFESGRIFPLPDLPTHAFAEKRRDTFAILVRDTRPHHGRCCYTSSAISVHILLVHVALTPTPTTRRHVIFLLEEIARRGSAHYANHPLRNIFNRVWFYDSLDSADEINQLLGFAAGAGRVRWLAELWPQFRVYPGSVGG
jgi:hypothetical protein